MMTEEDSPEMIAARNKEFFEINKDAINLRNQMLRGKSRGPSYTKPKETKSASPMDNPLFGTW